jgi:hypothetical protein
MMGFCFVSFLLLLAAAPFIAIATLLPWESSDD